jgi:hypothetical protein
MVIALASFVAVVALIFGTYWLCVVQPESSEQRALFKRMKVSGIARIGRADLLANDAPLGAGGAVDRMLQNAGGIVGPLQTQIDRADLKLSLGVVLLGAVLRSRRVSAWRRRRSRSLPAGSFGWCMTGRTSECHSATRCATWPVACRSSMPASS